MLNYKYWAILSTINLLQYLFNEKYDKDSKMAYYEAME